MKAISPILSSNAAPSPLGEGGGRGFIYLSLGSNLGNRHALLQQAIDLLTERVGVLKSVSSFLETEPWGFSSPHPFLNACVLLQTELTPARCLIETQKIEREMGRTQKSTDGRYHDRTIDIDILLYDNLHLDTYVYTPSGMQRLTIPHPLMEERDFVMIPLREILHT